MGVCWRSWAERRTVRRVGFWDRLWTDDWWLDHALDGLAGGLLGGLVAGGVAWWAVRRTIGHEREQTDLGEIRKLAGELQGMALKSQLSFSAREWKQGELHSWLSDLYALIVATSTRSMQREPELAVDLNDAADRLLEVITRGLDANEFKETCGAIQRRVKRWLQGDTGTRIDFPLLIDRPPPADG